jgi:hypothetical protein
VIKELKELETTNVHGADAPGELKLPYLTLKAEYYYHFGRGSGAVAELDTYVKSLGLRERLARWSKGGTFRFREDGNREGLRQEIWALIAVIFYGDYLGGNSEGALRDLRVVQKLIDGELEGISHQPDGSRSRVHYFIGQCHRSRGEFAQAEEHFLASQQYADKRLLRELGAAREESNPFKRNAKLQYEYQFGVICTARLQGSLGRNAMFQGQLSRALQYFYSARTLLAPSGQMPLKLVIDSHIAIAEARLTDPMTFEWRECIERLKQLHDAFGSREDLDGMARSAQELSRLWLERAAVESPGASRQDALESANGWIQKLGTVAQRRDQEDRRNTDLIRMHLLHVLRCLHHLPPVLAEAEDHMSTAQELDKIEIRHQLDQGGFDKIEIRLIINRDRSFASFRRKD